VILFAFEPYAEIALALENAVWQLQPGHFTVARFNNGELHAHVTTPVVGQHCVVLGSIAPPDEQFLSSSLLIHTLKKEGASQVSTVFPYLGYARHDKDQPGQSLATAWAGSLVKASGCDRLITVCRVALPCGSLRGGDKPIRPGRRYGRGSGRRCDRPLRSCSERCGHESEQDSLLRKAPH
jgi:N-terminal domain of ribose phosphate pyrophosphokinase